MMFKSNKISASNDISQTKTDDEEKKWKSMKNECFNVYILLLFRYK